MSEELIVRHCSPTLAGLKTGSLFPAKFADKNELRDTVRSLNHMLLKKRLRVLPLRYRNGTGLIYVYRPAHLQNVKSEIPPNLSFSPECAAAEVKPSAAACWLRKELILSKPIVLLWFWLQYCLHYLFCRCLSVLSM